MNAVTMSVDANARARASNARRHSESAHQRRRFGNARRTRRTSTNADARDASEVERLLKKVCEEPWDARAKSVKEFFAARASANVVEVDAENETVRANEIETPGLTIPANAEEAMTRVKANAVRFRQNYIVIASAVAFLGCECAAFGAALACFYAFAALKSDVILGEISLATKGKLKWNATRVGGVSRVAAQKATLATAIALFILSDAAANTLALIRSLMTAFTIALAHAMLRPIDLKGTLTDIMKDLKGAKSKEDLARAAEAGVKGFKNWWSNRRDAEPVPVIVITKDSKRAAQPSSGANATQTEPPPRRENAKGAIDVEGREAPNRKFLP